MAYTKIGIPTVEDYLDSKESILYKQLLNFSQEYLKANKASLSLYRWPVDALVQWSRRYEYQFCYENLRDDFNKNLTILDAGCGVTFFPFMIDGKYNVKCVDQDDYTSIFENINNQQKTKVDFTQSLMNKMPYESNSLDGVFCISVLEHTKKHSEIIKEFHRILKPGCKLIVTFDISLNNYSDFMGIDLEGAKDITNCISNLFNSEYSQEKLVNDINKKNLLTTQYVSANLLDISLPWPRKRNMKTMVKEYFFNQQNFTKVDITFCNLVATK